MFKRARISLLAGLISATLGFVGFLDTSIAQVLFYFAMAFALLSFLLALFEAEKQSVSPLRDSALQPRPIRHAESVRIAP
jgi:uncharacterized membrane protein YtjA (UPF0391 family)